MLMDKIITPSLKHRKYIARTFNCVANVAEGAVRAGKTIDNVYAFALNLLKSRDKIHLATGSTLANAKLNIGECNGLGLEYIFKGRCHWGKFKDNDALFININGDEKIVVFAGGGKADSYKKILGNSYGLWIATEINEHYDCEDSKTSFIKVAMARQLVSIDRKFFWDLNPGNPNHTIYEWYLDLWQKKGLVGGYNYEHFTIFDNNTLTKKRMQEIISSYGGDTSSIWYRRDILGERLVAEGLIYKQFADHPERYAMKYESKKVWKNGKEVWEDNIPLGYTVIGIDYGGTKSGNALVCTRISRDYSRVITLASYRTLKELNDKDLLELQLNFIEYCRKKFHTNIDYVYPDNEESAHIRSLDDAVRKKGWNTVVRGCKKESINDRITTGRKMMSFDIWRYIDGECDSLVEAISTAVWDSTKIEDERLDDGTSDIDSMDSWEYSWERDMKRIIDAINYEEVM